MLRFAPSPTGDMHIGNLRIALLNYIIATQQQKQLLLRIDDTDTNRNLIDKIDNIIALLAHFSISYHKKVQQSDNISFYQKMAMQLMSEGKAFACFCSQHMLDEKKAKAKANNIPYRYDDTCLRLSNAQVLQQEKPFVIRIKKPDEAIVVQDHIKSKITASPQEIDSFIILRTNKQPSYNFACAIDDMLHNISLVIRGDDHTSNTPKQRHILNALGYHQHIDYLHLPIILNKQGKKMSKRDNHSSVNWLLDEGFLPSAIANYLVQIGNQTPVDIFTIDESYQWFDIAKLSKSSAKFDMQQLYFINQAHLKAMPLDTLVQLLQYNTNIGKLAQIYLEEANTLNELKQKIDMVLYGKRQPTDFIAEYAKINTYLRTHYNGNYPKDFAILKEDLTQALDLKGKFLLKPLRYLLSGAYNGPDMSVLYEALHPQLNHIIKES